MTAPLSAGLCVGHPRPWLWDATVGDETPGDRRIRQRAARRICQACPALLTCAREYDHRYDEGVRFGVVLAGLKPRWRAP